METVEYQPLRLEDQCYLHLISHLDQFPPEALASLSIPIRCRLLKNLPAVDICQLEGTAVTVDLSMDLSIWKEVFKKRTGQVLQLEEEHNFKQHYFDAIYDKLFNGYLTQASLLLFSIKYCLEIPVGDWSGVQHPFPPIEAHSPTPYRHKRPFTGEWLVEHLIFVMINKCKCWPENLSIHCDQFSETDLWDKRGIVVSTFLRERFSKIKSVSFTADEDIHTSFSIPQFFLELIFSKPEVNLHAVSLNGPYEFLHHAVANLCLFFSSTSLQHRDEQHLHHSLYSRMLPNVPYNGLSSIKIVTCDDYVGGESTSFYEDLGSIIAYQTSLESVTLDCFDGQHLSESDLLEVLGSLFRQPQFVKLKLDYITLGLKELNLLIPAFLSSSTNPEHTKSLCIENIIINAEGSPEIHDLSDIVEAGLRGKALSLSDVSFGSSNRSNFFCWLSQYPCAFLRSFSFIVSEWDDSTETDTCTVMALFSGHRPVLLETLELRCTYLAIAPSPEVAFRNIFRGPYLRKVSLCDCGLDEDGLLPALTLGLLEQVPMGLVEELRLDGNDLGVTEIADLENFFDALFTLSTVPQLVLSIRRNGLKPHHFFLLYCSWMHKFSSCLRERLKQLLVSGNEFEKHTAELQDIAITGDFL